MFSLHEQDEDVAARSEPITADANIVLWWWPYSNLDPSVAGGCVVSGGEARHRPAGGGSIDRDQCHS